MSAELDGIHTLPQLLAASQERFGQTVAVTSGEEPDAASLTYSQLRQGALHGALVLRHRGLSPGERVALLLPNGPHWVVSFFAILEAGLVAVPLSTETPPDQVSQRLRQVDANALICAKQPPSLMGVPREVFDAAELLVPPEADRSPRPSPTLSPGDTAVLAFTSGTTGVPLAVELSHDNLLSNLRSLLQVDDARPGDVFLSLLPLPHLYELLVGLLTPLACGATVVYAGLPVPSRVVELLRTRSVTHTLAVPALLEALYMELLDSLVEAGLVDRQRRQQSLQDTAHNLRELTRSDLASLAAAVRQKIGDRLRFVGSGGAALPTAWEEILPRLGIRLECGYGLTQASPLVCIGRCGEAPPGSVGRPLPGVEVRISSDAEILVRGRNVMKGYYKDPAATEREVTEGWLHTGDLGYVDENGYLFLTGRSKEAIVTACGTCLDPVEFEACYRSPLFKELCVTALPDLAGNDLPTLVVVPDGPDVDEARVRREVARLRSSAPAHLRLQRIVILSGPLPRTLTGKLRRRQLAADLQDRVRDA